MNKIKNGSQGFTLLELLVVVLIIGILAAIALPQYKMAVLKSRFATVKQNTKTLYEANQRYYIINGAFSSSIDNLDIEVKSNNNKFVYAISSHGPASGQFFIKNGSVTYWQSNNEIIFCLFSSEDTSVFNMLDKFCKADTNGGLRGCNNDTNCYYYYNRRP